MVTVTEQKLRVVEGMLSYWRDNPSRWVQRTLGYPDSGLCLMGNLFYNSDMVSRYPGSWNKTTPLAEAVMNDLEEAIYNLAFTRSIPDYNDYECHTVSQAALPVVALRDRYRRELEPELVAISEHEYRLID